MTKFISQKNPISTNALKRKPTGSVVIRHGGREDMRFIRIHGGWRCERTDVTSEKATIVSSSAVAKECNTAMGCESSWAKVY